MNVFLAATRRSVAMKSVYWAALVLVIVGAVNWGLVGIAQFDLVAALFGGSSSPLSRVVYTLVGAAGLALAVLHVPSTSPAGSRQRVGAGSR
jgi:uncharacterized membrane protein YuzA (DUF378 family)